MKEISQTIHMLLSESASQPPLFYLNQYTLRERRDISQALEETLWGEIALFRSYIRKFFRMQAGTPEPAKMASVVKNLDMLGLSCTRLAKVMQVNHAISPSDRDDQEGILNQVLGALLQEWEGEDE